MPLRPTQRQAMARLNDDLFNLEDYVRQLRKRMMRLNFAESHEPEVFSQDEIEQLI